MGDARNKARRRPKGCYRHLSGFREHRLISRGARCICSGPPLSFKLQALWVQLPSTTGDGLGNGLEKLVRGHAKLRERPGRNGEMLSLLARNSTRCDARIPKITSPCRHGASPGTRWPWQRSLWTRPQAAARGADPAWPDPRPRWPCPHGLVTGEYRVPVPICSTGALSIRNDSFPGSCGANLATFLTDSFATASIIDAASTPAVAYPGASRSGQINVT